MPSAGRPRRSRWLTALRSAGTALALAALAGACGGSDAGGSTGAVEVATFCSRWSETVSAGDEPALLRLLEDPPAGLESRAGALLDEADARRSGGGTGTDDAAAAVVAWVDVHCNPDAAGDGAAPERRRVAPPPGGAPATLRFCSAGTTAYVPEVHGGVALYGEGARADPYGGPMLGVVWGPEEAGDHAGDGDATPVRVRGTDGVTAPITVFQQVIPDELGTVVAWRERGLAVGLYGRGWDAGRAGELVALADRLEVVDGGFRIPAAALPAGYVEVVAGNPPGMSLVVNLRATYNVTYQVAGPERGALVQLSGMVATAAEFDAFRFLAPGVQRSTLGDRPALVGHAWGPDGPAVVSWREADGFVVRLVGVGVDLPTVREAALAARVLTRDEWVALVESGNDCSYGSAPPG